MSVLVAIRPLVRNTEDLSSLAIGHVLQTAPTPGQPSTRRSASTRPRSGLPRGGPKSAALYGTADREQ